MKAERVIAAGPFLGELGWELSGFSGAIRYMKTDPQFSQYKFVVMSYAGRYPIYHDFADLFIPLPSWFTNLGLVQSSYEATSISPQMYGDLIKYMHRFFTAAEVVEVRTPRGHTFDFIGTRRQAWNRLCSSVIGRAIRDNIIGDRAMFSDVLVVMPRYRTGVSQYGDNTEFSDSRNWPPMYWDYVLSNLVSMGYLVVVAGTKNGIPNLDYSKYSNLINLSAIDPLYLMDTTLAFMEIAVGTVCSQSGGTHLSLQAQCPTWVLGHEKQRHAVDCNPLTTPCIYLECGLPYSSVDPQKALGSILEFVDVIKTNIHGKRQELQELDRTCCICGGEYSKPIINDIVKCTTCGLYKKYRLPSMADITRRLVDMRLGYMIDKSKEIERTKESNYQLSVIEKFVSPPGKLYDVGCGNGLFMSVAQSRGWDVLGNDVSRFAVESASHRYGLNIQYGFLDELVNDEDYNVFVLWHTLEHTINPFATMQYVYNHLSVGGIVQIAVPLKTEIELAGDRYEALHTYEFSIENLELLLTRCGFEIVYKEERDAKGDYQVHVIGRKTNV